MRCVLHASLSSQNCFLTLTYDEKKEGYNNFFYYSDIQIFKKKLRRHCEYHYQKKIQVFNVHEYGKNGKKHWHLVVFNHQFDDRTLHTVRGGIPLYTSDTLHKLWGHGFVSIGDVTEASAMYQAQYTQKDFKNGNITNGKRSHSKHAGIGKEYFLTHYRQILSLGFIPFSGRKIPIPRYFQRLAHKHYSHFYARENFEDTKQRKKLYSPFSSGQENREIGDLFLKYYEGKQNRIAEMALEWEQEISDFLFENVKTPFQQSGENQEHDLKNKLSLGDF